MNSSQLFEIDQLALRGWGGRSISIHRDNEKFSCSLQQSSWQRLPHWLLYCLSAWVPKEFTEGNRETIRYFVEVFGKKIVEQVVPEIQWRLERGIPLSLREVRHIFDCYEHEQPQECRALFDQFAPREQLTCIGKALKDRWNFERVVIDRNKGARFCRTASSIYQWIPEWILSRLPCLVSEHYRKENRETIGHFYSLFGSKRLNRISERFGLHLEEKELTGAALTRGDVEKIFLGLGEVRLGDVQELFQTVQSGGIVQASEKRRVGLFETEAVAELQDAFREKEFARLTKEDYDQLYSRLVPFEGIETIFLHHLPTFDSTSLFSGSLETIRKRVYICETIRREPDLEERIWDVWVAKAFLKRLGQDQDVLIPHPQGYYRVFGELQADGAYYLFMKALQDDLPSIVKAQGTRTGFSWDSLLSIIDDLLDEVGTGGVAATEDSLRYLLGDLKESPKEFSDQYRGVTKEPFYRVPEERFKGVAFSLGCAQMQLLFLRYRHLFRALSLACPPGITFAKCLEYAESERGGECSFRYFLEIDDLVHEGGEAKVGVGCDYAHTPIELVVFAPRKMNAAEIEEIILSPPNLPERTFLQLMAFGKAFTGAHVRQTTLRERERYEYAVFSNKNPHGEAVIQTVLGHHSFEELRKRLGRQSAKKRERVVLAREQVEQARDRVADVQQRIREGAGQVSQRTREKVLLVYHRAKARMEPLSQLSQRISAWREEIPPPASRASTRMRALDHLAELISLFHSHLII